MGIIIKKETILKITRILKRLQKLWADWRNTSNKTYFYHRVSEYREMWRMIAEEKGAKFTVLADDLCWNLIR